MSHFTVLVVGDNPEEQLAPFQENNMGDCPKEYLEFNCVEEDEKKYYEEYKEENQSFEEYLKEDGYTKDPKTGKYGYWENPNRKWDWYQLGGRWTGFFKLKNETKVFDIGSPGLMTEPAKDGYCDQARKKDIDIESMQTEAVKKATEEYDKVMELIAHLPKHNPWSYYLEQRDAGEIDIDDAREEYHSQDAVVEYKKIDSWGNPDKFLCTKEEYEKKAFDSAISTFAVLKDGEWYEKGKMGWWACVTDEKDNWNEEFTKLLESISDDTLLSIYDCHI